MTYAYHPALHELDVQPQESGPANADAIAPDDIRRSLADSAEALLGSADAI